MQDRSSPLSAEAWLADLFHSKAVMQGGVIRRKARDVERFAGLDAFMTEVTRRGFQVAENGGQFIIFCNRAPIRMLTPHSLKECGPKSFKDFGGEKSKMSPKRSPNPSRFLRRLGCRS